jgi:hypothetical protein
MNHFNDLDKRSSSSMAAFISVDDFFMKRVDLAIAADDRCNLVDD